MGAEGTEQKRERTDGDGQQCGDCRGWGGWRWKRAWGINNGKHTIKMKKPRKIKKKFETYKTHINPNIHSQENGSINCGIF